MSPSRGARRRHVYGIVCRLGLAVAPAGPGAVAADALRFPLTCTFKAIGVGQFHGSDYAPGPAGGLSTVTIAASPADLRLGRAAIVESGRAQVAALSLRPQQATLFGQDVASTTMLSVFTAAATDAGIPATYVRDETIGAIPVTVQATGLCRPQP